MILFISLIFVSIAIALYFVLPPLMGRYKASETLHNELNLAIYQQKIEELDSDNADLSEEQKVQAKKELEKSLLQDLDAHEANTVTTDTNTKNPVITSAVAVSIPLLALFMYSFIGPDELPEILMGKATPPSSNTQVNAAHAQNQLPDINKMVASLEEKLATNPNNPEGWYMLARSYMFMQNFRGALSAFQKATELSPEDPQLLVDYAEAIAMGNDGNLNGKPEQLIQQALAIDSMHPKSLWLAGATKSQQGQYQEAINYWEKLLTLHAPGSEGFVELTNRINAVKQSMIASGQTPAETKPVAATTESKTKVTVTVELDTKLKGKTNPEDTLFIFARAVNGPPMPLAIVRKQVKDLPLTVSLDDSMAMMPSARMSNFEKIYISARISKSGTAQTEAGDIQGRSKILSTGSEQKAQVLIETVVD